MIRLQLRLPVSIFFGLVFLATACTDDGGGEKIPAPEMFAAATDCVECHNYLTDEADQDVSIGKAWEPTMMANAARDPYFQAKVSAEIDDNPTLAAVIEDTCATCHIPMARTQLAADDKNATLFQDGVYSPTPERSALAMDGVSCTLCHQIEDDAFGESASYSGGFVVDATVPSPDRVNYGRWTDVEQEIAAIMAEHSGFTPVGSAHVTEAALCATCHTLYTPTVNEEGDVVGEFPEQTAFLEWQHGQFGDGEGEDTSCQGCHMPEASGGVIIGYGGSNQKLRNPFAEHHFVGGNRLVLGMLDDHREELEVEASEENFQAAFARVETQLKEHAAELTIVSADLEGSPVSVQLRLDNKAGHKLPTGYPSRRMWIHLTVTDSNEAVVFESGKPGAGGRIAGCDADADSSKYEAHYDEITSADQVQIYEPVLVDGDEQVTFKLLRAASYIKDNRIPPAGFNKQTAASDIAVAGAALTDEDFSGGSDLVNYRVNVSGDGPFKVTARLLYQSVSYPFAEEMRAHQTPEATQFMGFLDAADQTPVEMASATQPAQ